MEEPLSAMILCEIHQIAMIKQEILEDKSVASFMLSSDLILF